MNKSGLSGRILTSCFEIVIRQRQHGLGMGCPYLQVMSVNGEGAEKEAVPNGEAGLLDGSREVEAVLMETPAAPVPRQL